MRTCSWSTSGRASQPGTSPSGAFPGLPGHRPAVVFGSACATRHAPSEFERWPTLRTRNCKCHRVDFWPPFRLGWPIFPFPGPIRSKTNILGYASHKCQVFSATRAKFGFGMRFLCPSGKIENNKKRILRLTPFESEVAQTSCFSKSAALLMGIGRQAAEFPKTGNSALPNGSCYSCAAT
jgi:hypothetical protein